MIVFAHVACVLIVMHPKCKHCRIKDAERESKLTETQRKRMKGTNEQNFYKKNKQKNNQTKQKKNM